MLEFLLKYSVKGKSFAFQFIEKKCPNFSWFIGRSHSSYLLANATGFCMKSSCSALTVSNSVVAHGRGFFSDRKLYVMLISKRGFENYSCFLMCFVFILFLHLFRAINKYLEVGGVLRGSKGMVFRQRK